MSFNSTVFCEDEFWSYEKTWNTDRPKLTKCIGNVGFTIVPNSILILMVLFEFKNILNSKNQQIRLNKYNVTRLLICLITIGSNLILLMNYGYSIVFVDNNVYTLSDFFSSISKLVLSVSLSN